MSLPFRTALLTAILLLTTISVAQAQSQIHVGGSAAASPTDFTVDQLQTQLAADIKPIQYKSKGALHTFSCVPLISVLKLAGVQTDFVMQPGADPKTKNPQLRRAVVVTGQDGYTVIFSLAELLPSIGHRAAWIALAEDGKPLPNSDGPIRLIVPDDQMPARNVRQIALINVIDIEAPATRPESK